MRADQVKPHLLFVVNETSHYVEFRKIVNSKAVSERFRISILFDHDGYDTTQILGPQIANAETEGYEVFLLNKPQDYQPSRLGKTLHNISRYVLQSHFWIRVKNYESLARLLYEGGRFFNEIARYKNKIRTLRRFYKDKCVRAVVMGEENILLNTFLYTEPAAGIPIVVYPYTIPNPKEFAGAAYAKLGARTFRAKILKALLGRWCFQDGDTLYFLLHPAKIFALLFVPFIPKKPWILNWGSSKKICIESAHMNRLYKELGFPDEVLMITGSINDDLIHSELQKKGETLTGLLTKSGLPKKPVVLVSLPPNQFPVIGAEFSSYEQMVLALRELYLPFTGNYNFVFCKHPRLESSFDRLLGEPFYLTSSPAIELIPLAHLYIATVSATIRWAIAAGVPAINYDLFRYRYGDYNDAKGVLTSEDASETKRILGELLVPGSNVYEALRATQQQDAPQWGLVDGGSAERFSKLISSLI